jgi:hypothetical protein
VQGGFFENADVKSGRSAGLSKESAGEASNLMRRPVQQRNRSTTTSACVGWDKLNIENRLAFRKMARNRAADRKSRSKGSDHHQDDDPDHQQSGYLIDNTVKFLISDIAISAEIPDAAGKKAVDT